MGANEWIEHQGLERSVDVALELVQERVLASDEFRSVMPQREALEESVAMMAMLPLLSEAQQAELESALGRIGPDGVPATAADARTLMAENLGTGTVLDAEGLRPEPRPLGAPPPWAHEGLFLSPLPESNLVDLFGTATPSVDAILGNQATILAGIHRHDGRYLIGQTGSESQAVVFFGVSGD